MGKQARKSSAAKGGAAAAAGEAARSQKGRGVPSQQWLTDQVSKKLRDHFSSKSELEVDGLFRGERTLRQRLRHDTELWCSPDLPDAERPVLGPKYYTDLADLYSEEERAEEQLIVNKLLPENKRPIRDSLLRAVGAARLEHPNRALLRDWLAANKTASHQEVVLLLKLVCKQRATASNDQLDLVLNVMAWFRELGLEKAMKHEKSVMQPYFNMALMATGKATKSKPVPPAVLLRLHSRIVPLVTDADLLRQCVELKDDELLDNASTIEELCVSSPFAAWCLGAKRSAVRLARLQRDVDAAVAALLAKRVEQGDLDAAKSALAAKVAGYWAEPSKRRTVLLPYRGIDVPVKVQSVSQHLERAFEAAAKQQFQWLSEGGLAAFSIEQELGELAPRHDTVEVSEDLWTRWQLCRERANSLVAGLKDLHAITAMLKNRALELERMDPGANLELQFMASFGKDRALEIVEAKVIDILPNAASTATIAECSQLLAALRKSPLVTVGGEECLNAVVNASNAVGGLLLGRAPIMRRPSRFLANVLAKCQNFCRAVGPSGEELRGAAAASRLYTLLLQKVVADTPASDYEWMTIWKHHLTGKEQAEVQKRTDERLALLAEERQKRKGDSELLEAAVHSAGTGSAGSSDAAAAAKAKPGAKKKAKTAAKSTLDLALELL